VADKSGGFNDTAGIAFSSRQNEEKFFNGNMYYSTKRLMTLDESHFQATKTPNTGFVDARYL